MADNPENPFSPDGADISKYRDVSRYARGGNSASTISGPERYSRENTFPEEDLSPDAGFDKTPISLDDAKTQAQQYSRSSSEQYSHSVINKKRHKNRRKIALSTTIALVAIAIIAIAAYIVIPIKITINGKEETLSVGKTVQDAIDKSGIIVNPGNFVAVDYSIITKGKGQTQYIEVNGKEISDLKTRLHNGYELTYKDGKDIMEEYTSDDTDIDATATITGTGSIHKFSGTGEPGI